jgi:hypothetical protein
MGDIRITAKNITGKISGVFRQDAPIIRNIAGGKFIQNAKDGIVNGPNLEVLALRVTKVEGPFDDKREQDNRTAG